MSRRFETPDGNGVVLIAEDVELVGVRSHPYRWATREDGSRFYCPGADGECSIISVRPVWATGPSEEYEVFGSPAYVVSRFAAKEVAS